MEKVKKVLNTFKCSKNKDVEMFLKEKACLFENKNKSRTYLILKEESLKNGKIEIMAYFTLSSKVLQLPEILSKSQRKKIDGLYSGTTKISVFLIGQIAKNDKNKNDISGDELLEYALSYIEKAQKIIGGKVILIETKNEIKLINFYERSNFKLLNGKINNDENLLQMIKII